MYNILVISYTVLLLATFVLLMYTLGRRGVYTENGMALALVADVITQASLLFPLVSDDPAVCRICAAVTTAGIIYILVYSYVYLRQFTGNPLGPVPNGIVQALPVVYILLQWIPFGSGTPIYKSIDYFTYQGHLYCRLQYTVFGQVLTLLTGVICYLGGVYVLIKGMKKAVNSKWKESMGFMLVIYIVPVILALLRLIGVFNLYTNPTYIAVGIIVVAWGIYVTAASRYNISVEGEHLTFQRMETAAIVMDENKKFIRANDMGYRIFPALEGREGFDIRALFEFDIDDFEEGQTEEFEYGGEYYRAGIISLVDHAGVNKGYVLSLINITETFNFIGEIMELRDEADQANRAKSTFLANMSHEIRTPMNAIVGMSELIIEEAAEERVSEYALDIKTASLNLLNIINDILDISKVESGSIELASDPYMIEDLVTEVYNIVKLSAADKGLEITADIDPETPAEFYGDMGRVRQIVINIFNNAVKFTRVGSVSLRVSASRIDNEFYNLKFRIEDTGIGISQEDLEKLFERFQRVGKDVRRIEGSGLGLVIAKNFAEMMDGSIDVESEPGKGSVFTATVRQICRNTVPVSGKRFGETGSEAEEEAHEMFVSPGYTVLLVDDNKVNLRVASGLLSPYGFDIDQVTSGIDAIEKQEQKGYDMILMDHMMPEMDGIEAAGHILEACEGTERHPVMIALTANSFRGAREMFQKSGFSDYLSKPIDRTELHSLLCRWIPRDRRTPVAAAKEGPSAAEQAASLFIRGVDVKSALEHHSGGIAAYLELLELFFMDGSEKRRLIADLKKDGDLTAYEIELHALKSAAANIGALHLSELARCHEEAARSRDYSYVNRECDTVLAEYAEVLDEIGRVLKERGILDTAPSAREGRLTGDEISAGLRHVLELSESFKTKEAQEALDAILDGGIDPELLSKLRAIKNKFRMYDDDGAEELLKEVLGSL